MRIVTVTLAVAVTGYLGSCTLRETHMMTSSHAPAMAQRDREAILAHIHSIFQAYLRKDRATIRHTHTADWTGFQGPSVKIERGIEDYMINAERSLQAFDGTGYEILDTEIQLYGDVAVVYYVARYDYRTAAGETGSLPLRSVDVYRRKGGEWNQAGSHITPIPSAGNWGEATPPQTDH